ncbi:MAG: ribonuclease HII [Ruminococcus sp.]|jgi:ribonuclease HII|nr:ribonuclease HII [Ruminococcus sp.]
MNLYEYDDYLRNKDGITVICGVDEAGRGPLAGDVYAAAVVLRGSPIEGINDSKKLSHKKREMLYQRIIESTSSVSVGIATVSEIEEINILNAAMLAMKRAIEGLNCDCEIVYIDGNRIPSGIGKRIDCIIKGDTLSASIAAASIVAKAERDRYMMKMDEIYPEYGFAAHKGYGTRAHYEKIVEYGLSPIHRRTFLKSFT